MSTTSASDNARSTSTPQLERKPVEWPLRFTTHSYGTRCYDTYGCKVRYAGMWQVTDDDDEYKRSSESYGPDYLKGWRGGHLLIRNFPPPAEVSWRSKDGASYQARIDIGKIFQDQLIRHRVPREEVADFVLEGGEFNDPSILLEINDRTIRVYMKAFIPTKNEQIPGNKYSSARNDLILVETFTY